MSEEKILYCEATKLRNTCLPEGIRSLFKNNNGYNILMECLDVDYYDSVYVKNVNEKDPRSNLKLWYISPIDFSGSYDKKEIKMHECYLSNKTCSCFSPRRMELREDFIILAINKFANCSFTKLVMVTDGSYKVHSILPDREPIFMEDYAKNLKINKGEK